MIVLSCVRTAGTGFIDSPRRTNVALTRARHHLLIVGECCMVEDEICKAKWNDTGLDSGLFFFHFLIPQFAVAALHIYITHYDSFALFCTLSCNLFAYSPAIIPPYVKVTGSPLSAAISGVMSLTRAL